METTPATTTPAELAYEIDSYIEDLALPEDLRLTGTVPPAELPELEGMPEPGIGRYGDQLVAWGYADADDIIEVRRPIPAEYR